MAGDTFKSPFKGHHDFVVKQFVAFPASLIAELKKLKQRVFPKLFCLRQWSPTPRPRTGTGP